MKTSFKKILLGAGLLLAIPAAMAQYKVLSVPLVTQEAALAESWPYFAILVAGMALSAGYGPFMPLLLSIPDNIAGSLKITGIMYGTDSMLPGAMVSGGAFSNKNTTGGYRLKGKKWLWPGQNIVVSGVAVAAVAADLLMIDSVGFTLA